MSTTEHLPHDPSGEAPNPIMKTKQNSDQVDGIERKSLQTLQYSPTSHHLVGSNVAKQTKGHAHKGKKGKPMIVPSDGPLTIYADAADENSKEKAPSLETSATQTDDDLLEDLIQERLKRRRVMEANPARDDSSLVTGDKIPDRYWELLAEERRVALEETLKENRSLHEEIASLRVEQERLEDIVSKAQSLAGLLESVMSGDEDGGEEDGDGDGQAAESREADDADDDQA